MKTCYTVYLIRGVAIARGSVPATNPESTRQKMNP